MLLLQSTGVKELVLQVTFLPLSQFRGRLPSHLFFPFPQGQIFKEYVLQACRVCRNTGFIPVSTDMQEVKEVPQKNQVTLRSGRELRLG